MKITTTATLSKSITAKRQKLADDTEAVIAHLKFNGCFVTREEIDFLLGMPTDPPWARNTLFDELGAPLARLEIGAIDRELTASVRVLHGKAEMHVAGGSLFGLSLTLGKSGAYLAGELAWPVAGDETSDAEPLLGQDVGIEMNLTDGAQGDLLKAA